jgi:ubiquinone/menaquinone biosynthesis C-methylase UbiE
MNPHYLSLLPLIREKSNICDPEKFQSLINVIFHDYEARDYDRLHSEMWQNLPQQFKFISADISSFFTEKNDGLKLLDIGCGTALATDLLLKTQIGSHINQVHLLDTSIAMLDEAKKRAKTWGKEFRLIEGDISLIKQRNYDIILISSVLHHIPDLSTFLHNVAQAQNPGGILITIHDPCSEALQSPIYRQRVTAYNNHIRSLPFKKQSIYKRITIRLRNLFNVPDYIDRINNKLLAEKIIKIPLTENELWSITDIHVEGLPYSTGKGIDKSTLINALSNYSLASYRTYAFFGVLGSHLNNPFRKTEEELSLQKDMYGRNFCSAWIKKI